MPITLPEGTPPTLRVMTNDDVLVDSRRTSSWRFDLLGRDEVLLGELVGVDGGSVDFTATASIKGGGSIQVTDVPDPKVDGIRLRDADLLNVRIRPVCTIEGFDREIPVGIWLPSAPVENWTDLGRTWQIDLLDKASILDEDVWTHPASGAAETYVAEVGANVIGLVRELITQTGESAAAIEVAPGGPTISRAMVWEAGTTRLRIINDLLDAGGYFSLWVDYSGQFRCTPYARPADRPPVYQVAAPFTVGPTSLWDPDWTLDRDIFAVPNRFLCIGQGSGDTAALTATAINTDPASPYSYISRGRWITRVETGVEAVNQAALDLITQRKLEAATSVTSKLDVKHLFLPDLQINGTVRAVNPRADVDQLCVVTKTSVTFDPLGQCTSTLQEVVL